MNIRCLAIDDEPLALEKLKNYIGRVPFLELVDICDGPIDAMKVMEKEKVDAVFVDINMPDMNGLEFVESLSQCPLVVFTTAYSEYAVESYKLSAVDYLLKPFGFADFQRAANRLRMLYEYQEQLPVASQTDSVYVRTDYKWVRVALENIRFIQGVGDYLRLYFTDESKPLMTLTTFAQIKKSLPSNFLQVHRSYIVNMEQIQEVERLRIIMDANTYIPVGDAFKDDFIRYLESRSIGKTSKKQKNG